MEHVMNTYNRMPVTFQRGEGLKLYTTGGECYWDYLSGLGVNNLGHSHPVVVQAIREQAGKLIHVSNLYQIEEQARAAKLLAEASGMDEVFFCNSGAEANEALIKLARRYQRKVRCEDRYEIITAVRSFHGRTMGSLAATGQEKYHHSFEPLLPGFKYVPYNDIAAIEEAITPQTAAILLEPVQGEGGVFPADQGYLNAVATVCRREGLLFAFDEVQTGIGRSGSFYAYQRYGIRPDLVSSAKALAGGLPIGALMATAEVAAGFAPGSHASTFGGNPLVTSVAARVVQVVSETEFLNRVEEVGAYLEEQLFDQLGDIIKVRRLGLMIGIQLSLEYSAPEINQRLFQQEKILANAIGSSIIRVLPPLISTPEDCARLAQALGRQIFES